SSDFATQTASTTLNGSDSSPSTPATPPSVAATPPSAKPNVWTVRKELMNAVRSAAAAPPHNATSANPSHNLPHTKAQPVNAATDLHSQSSQPSLPAARSKPKRSAIPSDSGNTQSPALNQAQMTTPPSEHPPSVAPAAAKKKINSKSVSTSAQSTPAESPIPPLDEASSWPAPQEAALAGSGSPAQRGGQPMGSEDNKQGPSSHSRESSTVGSAHGKKQHWVRMPSAELQEAVDAAQPSSPHLHGSGRGKRGPDGERRPVAGRSGPGGGARSSGRNSKRSSAAPSPATRPNGLPSSGSATTPTLNANAVPFSSRNFPNPIYESRELAAYGWRPEYPGYPYGGYYAPPPPPMDYNPYGYADPYAPPPPPPPPQSSVPPPTPGGAQPEGAPYMMMPPYGYPVYQPPPPGMANPMMGYYYPPTGPQAFYPPAQLMPAGYPLDEPRASILRQVEFYLSYQNMTQDTYLRGRMDPQGWLDVEQIASFNRLRRLTSDLNLVREVMNMSALIEVSPDGQKCRMSNNAWQAFVTPQMDGIPQAENQAAYPQFAPDAAGVQQQVEAVPAPPAPQEEQNAAEPAVSTS
ncbi:hypothetical protein FRC00_004106, partial [Tulasnella sp. 408]